MRDLANGIQQLLSFELGDQAKAASVVDQLSSVLARCDELAFDSDEQSLAYICWHLLDRYGRIQQTLDALCRTGDLPLRKRPLTLLEIGAGPAPASYAVGDYYRQFAEWSRQTRQPLQPTPKVVPRSIDRGLAWAQLIHHLSEFVPSRGQARLYGTTYSDFRDFSTRRLHNEGILNAARRIQAEAERADEYFNDVHAREFALHEGGFPPSAYDLIVMCNFLTNPAMTAAFDAEMRELTYSLTPGGVLLILGGSGREYDPIYAAIHRIVRGLGAPRLKQVLSATFRAQHAAEPRSIVAMQIVSSLDNLRRAAPSAFEAALSGLPDDVRGLNPQEVTFPGFKALAYKREGKESIPQSDRRRIVRRRSAQVASEPTALDDPH